MDPSDLAGMQTAMNDVSTWIFTVVDLAAKARDRCLQEGFTPEAADLMGAEAFRVTLAICFPNAATPS